MAWWGEWKAGGCAVDYVLRRNLCLYVTDSILAREQVLLLGFGTIRVSALLLAGSMPSEPMRCVLSVRFAVQTTRQSV